MKRQGVIIGILVLALALLGGGWFLLREPQGAAVTESDAAAGDDSVLLALSESEVQEIRVESAEGAFSVIPGADGWEIRGMEDVPLDARALKSLVGAATSLKSVQEIADGKARPADFGLDGKSALASVEIAASKNERIKVKVGSEAPGTAKPSHYVEINDRICVCYDTKVGAFLKAAREFADPRITPEYESGSGHLLVESVTVGGSGFETAEPESQANDPEERTALSVRRTDSEEMAGVRINTYRLTEPVNYPADPSAMEAWLPSFFDLSAEEIVAVQQDGRGLPEVGLSEPWASVELTFTDTAGAEKAVSFDLTEPDSAGNAYARKWNAIPDGERQPVPVLYRVNVKDAAWIAMGPAELVSRQILAPSILGLAELTLEAEGQEPVRLLLSQNLADRVTTATWEGKELEDKSFRNFYYTLISQSADEVIFPEEASGENGSLEGQKENAASGGGKVAEIGFYYAENEKGETPDPDVITYYRESDRMLYVEKNGGQQAWRMSYTKLNTVLETWKKLLAGEAVEAKY